MNFPPKRNWVALLVAGLMTLAVGVAPSLARGFGPPHDPGLMMERLAERLDLTDDQEEAFAEAMSTHRKEMKTTRRQHREAREALEAAIHAELLDEASIRDAAAVLAAVESDRAVARARFQQQLRQILTPEQYDELLAARKEHRDRRRDGRGERHRGRGSRGDGF